MIKSKKIYIEKRVSKAIKVKPSTDNLTVDVPFVPDYIKVKYLDTCTKPILDTIAYDLIYTGDSLVPYQLKVSWAITSGKSRRFRYTVAKLNSFDGVS